ncbi:MAG TPA: hypothetical protein VEY30_03345, partial [Myxococcaceae bacterium]|nr:hypothetical protein [Myxococcaceae bacterium]
MSSAPDPTDPFGDLVNSLGGEAPASSESASGPKGGPPPLPPKRNTGRFAIPPGGIPPPTPAAGTAVARTSGGGDPFGEAPDPRPPKGASPDEKLEYFRALLKAKEETLGRARALYAERESEVGGLQGALEGLRVQEEALKAQLNGALTEAARVPGLVQTLQAREQEQKRLEAVQGRVPELEARVKEAARTVARLEAELAKAHEAYKVERTRAASAVQESTQAKAALQSAQSRVAELAAEKSEAEGNLEAVQEQYQTFSAENERLVSEVERLNQALEEANAGTADAEHFRGEAQALAAKSRELENALAEAVRKANALESEQDWSKSSLEEVQRRAQALEAEKAALAAKMEELHAQWAGKGHEAVRAAQVAQAALAQERGRTEALEEALAQERVRGDELESRVADLEQGAGEAAQAQIQELEGRMAEMEQSAGAARLDAEEELSRTRKELQKLQAALEAER